MNSYSIALFLHIAGAMGLFVALGLEWTGLVQLRKAMTLEQVRPWMGILKNVRNFGLVSMLATVITGIYLVLTDTGGEGWVLVTVGSLVLVIALAQLVTAPRMAAIGRALATDRGSFPKTFHGLAGHPLLSISLQTRVAVALGIVFLKTAQPDLTGSLLTIGTAIVLGLASTLRVPRPGRVQATATERPGPATD